MSTRVCPSLRSRGGLSVLVTRWQLGWNLLRLWVVLLAVNVPEVLGEGEGVREGDERAGDKLMSSKSVYTIGGLAIRDKASFLMEFRPTFETYLNKRVGPMFEPEIRFELLALKPTEIMSGAKNGTLDFVFLNPGLGVCLESYLLASVMLTIQGNRRGVHLDRVGGTIVALKNRSDINTLADIKGKKVTAVSLDEFAGGQLQFETLEDNGLSYLNDPAQLRLAYNEELVLEDVAKGISDIGFVPMDALDTWTKKSDFKILNTQNATLYDGIPYPYPISTQLAPNWPFMNLPLPHMDCVVAAQITEALLSLNSSHPAVVKGEYGAWRTSLSYSDILSLQVKLGNMDFETGQCKTWNGFYEGLVCKSGWMKKTQEGIEKGCQGLGREYTCPAGFDCVCQPCKRVPHYEIFNAGGRRCSKLQVCETLEQEEESFLFTVDDTGTIQDLSFSIFEGEDRSHGGQYEYTGQALRRYQNSTFLIPLRFNNTGYHIVKLTSNGIEISLSPILIYVVERKGVNQHTSPCEKYSDETILLYPDTWVPKLAYCLFGVIFAMSIAFGCWIYVNRENKLVVASQPEFLYIILVGVVICGASGPLIAMDDRSAWIDVTCNLALWLHTIGFSIIYAAIFAKIYRSKRLMIDTFDAKKRESIPLSAFPYYTMIPKIVLFDIIILTIKMILDPLKYSRSCVNQHLHLPSCRSAGYCLSGNDYIFCCIILSYHVVLLGWILWMCYTVRKIPEEFAEHKWITALTISTVQVLVITPFLVEMTWDDPSAYSGSLIVIISIKTLEVLIMLFIPKMIIMRERMTVSSVNIEDMLFNLRLDVRKALDYDSATQIHNRSFLDLQRERKKPSPIRDYIRGMICFSSSLDSPNQSNQEKIVNQIEKLKDFIKELESIRFGLELGLGARV
ncbi:hypothetical protein AAMO2058_000470200 [Amorphochlora amoebiformis]